jgi:uncharacterized protein (DUF885 family)
MRLSLLVKFILVSVMMPVASLHSVAVADDSTAFRKIYEAEWDFRLKEFPLMASYTGNDAYADKLGHVSEADQKRRYDYWTDVQQQLQAISCERLSHEDCINFRLYQKQVSDYLAKRVFGGCLKSRIGHRSLFLV